MVSPSSSDNKVATSPPSSPKPAGAQSHLASLGMLQLVGITYFSACGGPFGFEEAYVLPLPAHECPEGGHPVLSPGCSLQLAEWMGTGEGSVCSISAGGGPACLLAICVVPLIWSVPLALMTAELATMIPESGGHIVWIDRALGPYFGCMNCVFSFFTNCFDNALYPVMFVDYLEEALIAYTHREFDDLEEFFLRLVVIILCSWLNIKGADLVGDMSVVFGVVVLSPFIVMTFLGISPLLEDPDGLPGAHLPSNIENGRWGAFLSIMLWNTAGFDNAGTCAAEVKDPGETYPRALAISIILVVLTYAAPTLIGTYYIPDKEEWEDGVFVEVGEEVGGSWLRDWMGFAGVVSSLAILCTMLCTTARMLEGMANTGNMPQMFANLHSKYGTPYNAIMLNGVATLILSRFSFAALAEVDMLFYNMSTLMKFAALIRLRYMLPHANRPFKIPLGNKRLITCLIPPMLTCISAMFLFGRSSIVFFVAVWAFTSALYWLSHFSRWHQQVPEHQED